MPNKSKHSLYSPHPSLGMVQKWISDLKAKTGRSLPELMSFIAKNGPSEEKARRDWLKNELRLPTNTAWWLAERSVGKGGEEDSPEAYLATAEKYVAAQYSGAKAELYPIYEELLKFALSVGKDVKACPGKTFVPLYRTHVIASITAAARNRIDFGLALGGMKGTKRLVETGGYAKKDRITHKVAITSKADIDDQLKKWLKMAYEGDE